MSATGKRELPLWVKWLGALTVITVSGTTALGIIFGGGLVEKLGGQTAKAATVQQAQNDLVHTRIETACSSSERRIIEILNRIEGKLK